MRLDNISTTPFKNRKYLNISNDNDDVIPSLGSVSQVGMEFFNAQDAVYVITQSQGYNGNKLPD